MNKTTIAAITVTALIGVLGIGAIVATNLYPSEIRALFETEEPCFVGLNWGGEKPDCEPTLAGD